MARRCRCFALLVVILFCLTTSVLIVKVNAQTTATAIPPTIDQPYPSKIAELGDPHQQLMELRSLAPATAGDAGNLLLQPASQQAAVDWWWRAFQSNRSGNWEIYRVRENGGELAQLTFHPAADTQPRLNRGVTAIVFVSARDGNPELYRMNADGGNQIRLTNHPLTDTHPSWSPDSNLITFVSTRDGNAELYQLNADGSGLRRLTTDPALDLFPAWSPDGQQLVWVRAAGDNGWLWLMNRDGSNARAVSGPLRYLQHPAWSPDGTEIMFDYDPDRDYFNELGLFTVANGRVTLFVDGSDRPVPYPGQELWMGEWSPNGNYLYYTQIRYFWQPADQGYVPLIEAVEMGFACRQEPCSFLAAAAPHATFDLWPSVQTADYQPPRTAVDPLPAYRRRVPLFVTWGGTDRGPAGIATYDLQVRSADSNTWQDWLRFTDEIGHSLDSAMSEGVSTLYFRSRGIDQAENEEAWPAATTGDTAITFYDATLRGRVTDLRGIGRTGVPLPLLPAGLNPAVTDAYGDYFVRLPTSGEYQINGLRINTDADRVQPFYLDPPQNLLKNGDFESFTPLEHWQGGGSMTPTLTISQVSSGLQGAQLGFDCGQDCVAVDDDATTDDTGSLRRPLWTPDGKRHLFSESNGMLYHRIQLGDGVWSDPEQLGSGYLVYFQATGDHTGNLHLAWPAGLASGNQIVTMDYSVTGGWGLPVPLAAGEQPKMVTGNDGSTHLLYWRCTAYCNKTLLLYRWRTVAGGWSPEITVSEQALAEFALVAADAHQVHLFWGERDPKYKHSASVPTQLHYQRYAQGQPIAAPTLVDTDGIFGTPYLDQQATLHLFGRSSGTYYTQKVANGTWSTVDLVSDHELRQVVFASNQTLHLFTSPVWAKDPWLYRYQSTDGVWATPHLLDLHGYFPAQINADEDGQFHAITNDGEMIQFPPKIAAGQSTLSQAVTLPATLHEPTLSWLVETQGRHQGQSSFQVRVSTGVTQTVLYSTTAAQPLALQWADMSPWLGQTVTVTFAVSQAAAEIPFRAFLDHIALGAWETPAPAAVEPAQVEAGVSTSIVISGANFMATPQVTLAGKPLTNVRLLSPTALAATLPATVAPGIHDLVVTNPGGVATVLPNAVKVGKQLYLPAIQR